MNIFLVGFMGSGKTTLGRKLARRLDFSFVDMDDEIEKQQGKPIHQLFSDHGETHFRQLESNWLATFNRDRHIIATGGGAPCFNHNMDFMKTHGITLYLRSSAENLCKRLLQSSDTRPLIEPVKSDPAALLDFVRKKLTERAPFYEKADLVIDALDIDAGKLDELAADLKQRLYQP